MKSGTKQAAAPGSPRKKDVPAIPPLRALYFNPSPSCNLKCAHCWVAPRFQEKPAHLAGELSLPEIRSLFREARSLGAAAVKLTGGEPLLKTDIKEVMRAVRLEGLRLQVETNATLVDAPIAGILSDIFREDPGTFVSVSLDGGRDVHERRRGVPGCFDAALEGIRRLREGGIRVQVICSLARDNRDEVDVVVRLAERLGAASLKFNFVNDVMRGKRMERWGRRLDVTECLRLERERIAPLGKTAPFPVYTNLPPAFRTIPGIMRGGRCGINGIAGVLFDGSVSFCGIGHFVPELIAGNLREQPFSRIWREGRVFRELRRTVPRRLKGTCGRCMLRGFCLGHCRADAFSKTGRLDTPFSFCEQAEKEGVFPKKWRIPDPAS